MRTLKEVSELRGMVNETEPSKFPGMSYEQGLADALEFVQGDLDIEDLELDA